MKGYKKFLIALASSFAVTAGAATVIVACSSGGPVSSLPAEIAALQSLSAQGIQSDKVSNVSAGWRSTFPGTYTYGAFGFVTEKNFLTYQQFQDMKFVLDYDKELASQNSVYLSVVDTGTPEEAGFTTFNTGSYKGIPVSTSFRITIHYGEIKSGGLPFTLNVIAKSTALKVVKSDLLTVNFTGES